MIDKFIHVGNHCRALNNFFSVFTVASALDTPKVRKSPAWESVSKESRKALARLQAFTTTDRNMKVYRSAVRSLPKKTPRVLFLPLLMKDMRFLADGNPSKIDGLHNFERCGGPDAWRSMTGILTCRVAVAGQAAHSGQVCR
jgi:Rap guanine nucleotide exchange factor 5